MSSKPVVLGVIGGSGVYKLDGIKIREEHQVITPFGDPSDRIIEAELDGATIYFLPRHGRDHSFLPSEVNYRANIYALKTFGVTHMLSVCAVGIMREDVKPGDMIVPDQIFDRTKGLRPSTFFGNGIVGHVEFGEPYSAEMRKIIIDACSRQDCAMHAGGAIVVVEGPQFSTRAESIHYRETLDPICIGMTALPEANLAREANMACGLLAMATDYDCWRDSEEAVNVETVMAVLKANATTVSQAVAEIARSIPKTSSDPSLFAGSSSIMTPTDKIPAAAREIFDVLHG